MKKLLNFHRNKGILSRCSCLEGYLTVNYMSIE
jgi:hypothetical protein